MDDGTRIPNVPDHEETKRPDLVKYGIGYLPQYEGLLIARLTKDGHEPLLAIRSHEGEAVLLTWREGDPEPEVSDGFADLTFESFQDAYVTTRALAGLDTLVVFRDFLIREWRRAPVGTNPEKRGEAFRRIRQSIAEMEDDALPSTISVA